MRAHWKMNFYLYSVAVNVLSFSSLFEYFYALCF